MSSIGNFIGMMSKWQEKLLSDVRRLEEASGYSIQELIDIFEHGYKIEK